MENRLEELNLKLHSLVIFRGLLEDEGINLLSRLLESAGLPLLSRTDAYAAFAARLFGEGPDFTAYLWDRTAALENPYVKLRAEGRDDAALRRCAEDELRFLTELSGFAGERAQRALGLSGLPVWENTPMDFVAAYEARMADIGRTGYGVYAKHNMFLVKDGSLRPVVFPDPVRLCDLKGYERERGQVVENTLALLRGRPAANALLYGDAGTGKSSTVKAVVNEYAGEGLRLAEIRKDQILEIPAVAEQLSRNPLKFILFLDDLSFTGQTEEAGVLKAILEGSASAKAQNIAVYATSNRRHLIGERFSDRGDDDIHRNETMEEQASLSERFGLRVNFGKPDKAQYLRIVEGILEDRGIRMGQEERALRAERYALEHGGRSPRVARQFAEHLMSKAPCGRNEQ